MLLKYILIVNSGLIVKVKETLYFIIIIEFPQDFPGLFTVIQNNFLKPKIAPLVSVQHLIVGQLAFFAANTFDIYSSIT